MANFLRGLGQLAGVAGQAVQGYGIDRENAVRQAMLKAREKRDAEQLALAKKVAEQQMATGRFGALLQAHQAGYRKPTEIDATLREAWAPSGVVAGGVALPKNLVAAAQITKGRGNTVDVPGAGMLELNATQTPEALAEARDVRDYGRRSTDRKQERAADRQYAVADMATKHQYDLELERARIANEPPQIVQGVDEEGKPKYFRVDRRGGPAWEVEGISGKENIGGRGAAAMQKKVAQNQAMLAMIDRAEAAINQRPESFGPTKGAGLLPGMQNFADPINEWLDPKGVGPRAPVSNLGSMVVFNRSGSAVSMTEFGRQAGFVPGVYNTPESIRAKLNKMREQIIDETEAFSGYRLPRPGEKNGLPETITGVPSGGGDLYSKYGLERPGTP